MLYEAGKISAQLHIRSQISPIDVSIESDNLWKFRVLENNKKDK